MCVVGVVKCGIEEGEVDEEECEEGEDDCPPSHGLEWRSELRYGEGLHRICGLSSQLEMVVGRRRRVSTRLLLIACVSEADKE